MHHDRQPQHHDVAQLLTYGWSWPTGTDGRQVMAENQSPIGTGVAEHSESKRAGDPRYRLAQDNLRPFEHLARAIIMRRARLGLSQQDLAKRMGTTASVISRIESGQHRTSTETLRRVAEALEGHAILGFDFGTDGQPEQELVRL